MDKQKTTGTSLWFFISTLVLFCLYHFRHCKGKGLFLNPQGKRFFRQAKATERTGRRRGSATSHNRFANVNAGMAEKALSLKLFRRHHAGSAP
ncbi:MAG TPA: hypothetical protein VI298_11030 [Geobacteraceae bacterium]